MDHYLNSLFVLLVEPSRSQRRILLQQFEDLGISQFETYDRGEEALVRIDTEQPDLVISALFLPDMTGRELVLEMRDNPLSLDIPFILISSETSIRELDPVKQAGASAVLPKPFAAADLKRAINMIMDWENPQPVELDSALRILLVDDSKLARRMISRTLRRMGLENIVEAEDGRAALPLIQRQDFDLIITDYNMPRMDGRELLWFIRNKSRQPKVPVMMVTTEGDESKLSAVQHQGVSAIIDKPFDAAVVKSLIESMA
jgi:two-component system chemotaxis response regulator CheY